ncbi:hypothetical protein ACC725_38570, partial [Rhizobium ruizarguesonis]
QGGPITIGYGRYAPGQSLTETIEVDDVIIVLEGQLSVSTDLGTVTSGPGDIVYMPKGEALTIRSPKLWSVAGRNIVAPADSACA